MGFNSKEDIYIPAPGHGAGYEYVVSYGEEEWSPGHFQKVCKVRIVQPPTANRAGVTPQHGQILGRQAPSYPNYAEWLAVRDAMDKLMLKYMHTGAQPMGLGKFRATINPGQKDETETSVYSGVNECHPDYGPDMFWVQLPPNVPVPKEGDGFAIDHDSNRYKVKQVWDQTGPTEAPGSKLLLEREKAIA